MSFSRKKNNKTQVYFNDLKLFEDDEFYYYDAYSEKAFDKIFISVINYIHKKKKRLRICSYKVRIEKIPPLTHENIKYIIRITKEESNMKTFLLYNLKTKIAYAIICENNENFICSDSFIGDIQADISIAFEKGSMDDLIVNHGISYKSLSN